MARHLLSDKTIKAAKPQGKAYRLFDGEGLAVLVLPSGVKSWQFRYTDGTATIGRYPRLSLAAARARADEVRELVDRGVNYAVHKREQRLTRRAVKANSFAAVAADWVAAESRRCKWTPRYRMEVEASLRNHLAGLDRLPVSQLTAPILSPVLRKIEGRAPHMLEKVRRRLDAILDYAVEHGVIAGNPLPAVRRGRRKGYVKHYPAVTKVGELGAILRRARAADPCKGVRRAHLLLAFTAQRVSEVVGAPWAEFELEGAGTWTIPRDRMKRKDQDAPESERLPHIVPLPPRLLAELRRWRDEDGPDAVFVCPAPRNPRAPVTAEAVEKFYRRALELGGKHSPHSWRAAFSTVCREAGKDADVVEAQLDHIVGSKIAAAYDRAKRVELRRELLGWYEEVLTQARDGAQPLEGEAA